MIPLILASASPRRSQLLHDLELEFEVRIPFRRRTRATGDDARNPGEFVERLAQMKARAVEAGETEIVVAADTVVVIGAEILGKPRDESEALEMLSRMQGRTHQVFTGVCVRRGAVERLEHETTSVTFGAFDEAFCARIVGTGEPLDKAGAYGAQGAARCWWKKSKAITLGMWSVCPYRG
jgi:septum formation protein